MLALPAASTPCTDTNTLNSPSVMPLSCPALSLNAQLPSLNTVMLLKVLTLLGSSTLTNLRLTLPSGSRNLSPLKMLDWSNDFLLSVRYSTPSDWVFFSSNTSNVGVCGDTKSSPTLPNTNALLSLPSLSTATTWMFNTWVLLSPGMASRCAMSWVNAHVHWPSAWV